MSANFDKAVEIVLEAEGVFSNQVNDPGGETWYGIARKSHPNIPWPPSKAQAIEIYQTQYWDTNQCDSMPWPWALAIFDGEVNQGSVIKVAQTVLGLRPDGVVGPQTLKAIQGATQEQLNFFFAGRALSYIALGTFPSFGKGWLKRLFNIRANAT